MTHPGPLLKGRGEKKNCSIGPLSLGERVRVRGKDHPTT
jgi:hypothetical protein